MTILGKIFEALAQQYAEDIVDAAFVEALAVMGKMPVNAGQITVYEQHIVPEFIKTRAQLPVEVGVFWDDVVLQEYIDFMGEIMEAGNQIMHNAYVLANTIMGAANIIF